MAHHEPAQFDQLQYYRPGCSKCGAPASLAWIEPADEPGYDLRTYECIACRNADTVAVRFR